MARTYQQFMRGVAYSGPEPSVVLKGNAADATLDLLGVFLVKILYDIKLHVSPTLAGKPGDRIHVADRLESLAHQHQAFFFDLDDPPARMCVGLERISRDRPGRRRRLVEQQRNCDVTLAPQLFGIDVF